MTAATSLSSPDTPSTPARSGFPPGPAPRKGLLDSARYLAAYAWDPIAFVRRRFEAYGDVYYAPNKDGGLFVFRHPEHLREILSTKASSFTKQHGAFVELSRVLGKGLLTSDGDTWKRHRRMMNPAFAPARITEYGAIAVEEALATARLWERGGTRSISRDMSALTLRVVSRSLFGQDVPDAGIQTVARAMRAFELSFSTPNVLPSWVPGSAAGKLARSVVALDDLIRRLIEDRQRAAGAAHGRRDLLEVLVRAVDPEGTGDGLTLEEVRDQIVTLFMAGHDTTARALGWTFYALAKNPEIERKLHRELDDVLGDRAPSVADLERLPYTEQVLSEALRMYPPAYAVGRRAKEDVVIGEWTVPRGSEVMAWIYLTHHDARFFPEPERFLPERFAPEAMATIPKNAFLPFGAGPRACIGKAFAMLEARLVLATLAQRYRLVLEKGTPVGLAPRITLAPKRALGMKVLPRR